MGNRSESDLLASMIPEHPLRITRDLSLARLHFCLVGSNELMRQGEAGCFIRGCFCREYLQKRGGRGGATNGSEANTQTASNPSPARVLFTMMLKVGARCVSPRNGADVPLRGQLPISPSTRGKREDHPTLVDRYTPHLWIRCSQQR